MRWYWLAAVLALGVTAPLGSIHAAEIDDLDEITVQVIDDLKVDRDRPMRVLELPSRASDRGRDHAEDRDHRGISRANDVRDRKRDRHEHRDRRGDRHDDRDDHEPDSDHDRDDDRSYDTGDLDTDRDRDSGSESGTSDDGD